MVTPPSTVVPSPRRQLVFEVLRWGFDGRVAIDDVALLERPCAVPRLCSFEGQVCGYTSSGAVRWGQRNGLAAAPTGGPKADHTLETEMGEGGGETERTGGGRGGDDQRESVFMKVFYGGEELSLKAGAWAERAALIN